MKDRRKEMKLKILAMGDSLTLGEIGSSYLEYLDEGYEAVNRGVNGDTTEGVSERLDRIIHYENTGRFDVLIFFAGINDLLFFSGSYTDELFEEDYRRTALNAADYFKNIILVSLPYAKLPFLSENAVMRRNEIIRKTAEECGCSYIDLYSIQKERADEELTIDGVHFTPLSARLLAEAVEKQLNNF